MHGVRGASRQPFIWRSFPWVLAAVQAGFRTRHVTTVAITVVCRNITRLANLHAIHRSRTSDFNRATEDCRRNNPLTPDVQSELLEGLDHLLALLVPHEPVVHVKGDDLLGRKGVPQEGGAHGGIDASTHQHLQVERGECRDN